MRSQMQINVRTTSTSMIYTSCITSTTPSSVDTNFGLLNVSIAPCALARQRSASPKGALERAGSRLQGTVSVASGDEKLIEIWSIENGESLVSPRLRVSIARACAPLPSSGECVASPDTSRRRRTVPGTQASIAPVALVASVSNFTAILLCPSAQI